MRRKKKKKKRTPLSPEVIAKETEEPSKLDDTQEIDIDIPKSALDPTPEPEPEFPPLTADDLRDSSSPLNKTSDKELQFQADVINVYEKRVDISDFPPEYQKRIQDYYRFSSVLPSGPAGKIAQIAVKRSEKG